MAEDTKFDRREFQVERIRETARYTAKKLRSVADEIDRIAAKDDYVAIPYEVMNAVVWGLANARPDSPAQQLRELMISDQADATIAARKAQEAVATETVAQPSTETAEEIAESIAGARYVVGFGGVSENTRRIVKRAIIKAVQLTRGIPCEECHRIAEHKMDCSVGRLERSPRPLPAEYVEEGENR